MRGVAKWRIGAGVAAVLALIAGVLVWISKTTPRFNFPPPRSITALPGVERDSCLSPDGTRVFFAWNGNGPYFNIFSLAIGESRPARITESQTNDLGTACSPDGLAIAFMRERGDANVVIVKRLSDLRETEIRTGLHRSVAWAPDSRSLVVSVAPPGDSASVLLRIDLSSLAAKTIIPAVAGGRGDVQPAYSPDGRRMVFVRYLADNHPALFVAPANSPGELTGVPRQVAGGFVTIAKPGWTPDNKTILFSSGTSTSNVLWCVAADGSTPARRIEEAGERIASAAVASGRWRMILDRNTAEQHIWRVELTGPGGPFASRQPVVESTWDDEEQVISPAGDRLAFISHRTGSEQVWFSSLSGAKQEQVSFFPRPENLQLFFLPGEQRLLVTGQLNDKIETMLFDPQTKRGDTLPGEAGQNLVAGVSRDGRSIYSLVRRSGATEVWRFPMDGSAGAFVFRAAIRKVVESADGAYLYFSYRPGGHGIGRIPAGGGTPEQVVESVSSRAFAVARTGIYFISGEASPDICYYRFSDKTTRVLAKLSKRPGYGFDISADERTLFYTQFDQDDADLLLVDEFRL